MNGRTDQNQEALYNVVWPLGKSVRTEKGLAPRISDLNGKVICVLSDGLFRMQEIISLVQDSLLRRYSGIKIVNSDIFGDIHGAREDEVLRELPHLLHQHSCDAVISGVGS